MFIEWSGIEFIFVVLIEISAFPYITNQSAHASYRLFKLRYCVLKLNKLAVFGLDVYVSTFR